MFLGLFAFGNIGARSPVSEEGAVIRKYGNAAGSKPFWFDAVANAEILEIPERPTLLQRVQVLDPSISVIVVAEQILAGFAVVPLGFGAENPLQVGRQVCETEIRIHLPKPVRRRLGIIPKALFVVAQDVLGPLSIGNVGPDANGASAQGSPFAGQHPAAVGEMLFVVALGRAKLSESRLHPVFDILGRTAHGIRLEGGA